MTPIKLWFACAYLCLQALQPTPPRQPTWKCGKCSADNESWRKKCMNGCDNDTGSS